jgi:hypothetical protein
VRSALVQVALDRYDGPTLWLGRWNRVAKWLGYLASFGMLVVAAFQSANVGVVHGIGATMTFGGGWFYSVLHSWLSYRLDDRRWHFRVAIALLSIPALGACACGGCRVAAGQACC